MDMQAVTSDARCEGEALLPIRAIIPVGVGSHPLPPWNLVPSEHRRWPIVAAAPESTHQRWHPTLH